MRLESRSARRAVLGFGLAAALGSGMYAAAQTAAPPAALTAEQRLCEERRAIREAERMARLEGRLTFLRLRLGITDAQALQWNAFSQALRAEQAARNGNCQAVLDTLPGPPPLSERLERRRADLAARSQRLAAVTSAFTPLYAALSAGQKLVADRLLRVSDDGRIAIIRDRDRGR